MKNSIIQIKIQWDSFQAERLKNKKDKDLKTS